MLCDGKNSFVKFAMASRVPFPDQAREDNPGKKVEATCVELGFGGKPLIKIGNHLFEAAVIINGRWLESPNTHFFAQSIQLFEAVPVAFHE